MAAAQKLLTPGGGGVIVQPASSIASDVTVQVPSQNCTLGIQGPAFSAYLSANQTGISSGVLTKITFDAEAFDTNSTFASGRFTPNIAGYYQINGCVSINTPGGASNWASIYKNGSEYRRGARILSAGAATEGCVAADVVYMNGSTDYVEIYAFSNGGTWFAEGYVLPALSYFSGTLVRAA